MKTGDAVYLKYWGNFNCDLSETPVGILLTWWELPGDEERYDEIYWKVLVNGKIKDIKERHLVLVK